MKWALLITMVVILYQCFSDGLKRADAEKTGSGMIAYLIVFGICDLWLGYLIYWIIRYSGMFVQ